MIEFRFPVVLTAAALVGLLPAAALVVDGLASGTKAPEFITRNEGNGRYLHVGGEDVRSGRLVRTETRSAQPHQQWISDFHSDGTLSLRSLAGSRTMCANAHQEDSGYVIRLRKCSGRDSEKFHPYEVRDKYVLLENHKYRDQALATEGGNDAAVLTEKDFSDSKQLWSTETAPVPD